MRATRWLLAVFAILVAACAQSPPRPHTADSAARIIAEPWHEADRLFFENPDTPEWKGADVANSVALDTERVLWVFGDTLLAEPGVNSCDRFGQFDILVHNSLAVQQGTDPTTGKIRHFWGVHNGEPESFFSPQENDGSWYWMGGVTVIGDQALVFLMHARATSTDSPDPGGDASCAGLNFEMLGWDARIATITPQTPDKWLWRDARLPHDTNWHNILAGSSTVTVDGNFLYAWSAGPATLEGNPVFLARWPLTAATAADLSEPQWYTQTGWKTQLQVGEATPAAIVSDGNNEISISKNVWPDEPRSWWWLQSTNVINSSLCYRNGESPLGFGKCQPFMEPPELRRYPDSTLLVYAAKFHPALSGQGEDTAIATYVVNSCSLRDIQTKCDLYYPRFLKLRLRQ
jgi:hypothetical protein